VKQFGQYGFGILALASIVTFGAITFAQPPDQRGTTAPGPTGPKTHKYDLLLRGGHVIDAKNKISAVRDVALSDGKIALVAEKIDPAEATKTIDAKGLYVTPGLIDIHAHVYTNTGEPRSYAGDSSVAPDGFTFRVGVTTVADAGGAGWRNFDDFKTRIIDRSRTRVFSFLNIVGNGMRGGKFEQNVEDMDAKATGEKAKQYPGVIVGIKTAHFSGPEWIPVERGVEAGTIANIPLMVDFGINRPERPIEELLTKKLRPGDIYTHVYSGLRREQLEDGKINPALIEGRKRGVIFDVGHGGGSFLWRVAMPLIKQGFLPDSISTDLHIGSMNAGMKDQLNVMSKFLAMGVPLDSVFAMSTWHPAKEIKQDAIIGHLSPGADADIAVFSLEKGKFGYADMYGARLQANQRLMCELTIRNGRVVYDLNGISRPDLTSLPKDYMQTGNSRWDGLNPVPRQNPGTGQGPEGPRRQQ
jgi:dihydroorotase